MIHAIPDDMIEHDPMCPVDEVTACCCGVIARVREDERERTATAIEAKHGKACAWDTHTTGTGVRWKVRRVYYCTCEQDAAIARSGGQEER